MARIKGGIGENISGKLGNMVFVQREGVSYVRMAPEYTKNSWTPRQKLHRERFRKVNEFCVKFRWHVIIPIWNLLPGRASGYHQFLKANMPAFGVNGELADPSLLHFAAGNLPVPYQIKIEWKEKTEKLLQITWENDSLMNGNYAHDELLVICYGNNEFAGPFETGIERMRLQAEYKLPPMPEDIEAVFVYFAASNRKNYSPDRFVSLK